MRAIVPCLVLLAALAPPVAAENRVVQPPGPALALPFSPGVLSDDFLFLSGAIGNEPGVAAVEGDAAAQARRTIDNLKSVLAAAGLDFSRVVSGTVFLADARLLQPVAEALAASDLEALPPALTGVEADVAIPNAALEMSAIAARPGVEVRPITPPGWPAPALPYSYGVLAGDLLFLAGQVGWNPASGEVPQDFAAQVEQALANVGAVLKAAGMDYGNAVTCRVYLADGRDFQAMNEAWKRVFTSAPPSRATVRARLADPRFKVEIQCIAARGAKKVVVAAGESAAGRPFSPAVQVGDRLFLSGFVGRGREGYPAGVAAQTRRVLERLAATLAAAGMSFADVVNAEVYLSDVRFYAAMNEVYGKTMPKPPPARATVGSQLMSPEALVEIAMIAVRSSSAGGENGAGDGE